MWVFDGSISFDRNGGFSSATSHGGGSYGAVGRCSFTIG